jgi:tetratricopeptide (TPR) repeat protein
MRLASLASIALLIAFGLAARGAGAQDRVIDTREAGKHFDHGVVLYGEADYPAALAEFKRAYALAPNSAVLFNIGEAQFQLQDYAGALASFTRYLVEAPPGASHRTDVENDIEILRTRVGHLTIVTLPAGAEVSIDEQPAGKTPLDDRVLVSVGHRKVTATFPDSPAVTRYVDVAADDDIAVTLQASSAPAPAPRALAAPAQAPRASAPQEARSGVSLPAIGWIATGVLAAGAVSTGIVAWRESVDLRDARASFPVSAATLQEDSDRTRTFSIVADSFTAAAVVLGSITLASTIFSHRRPYATETAVRLQLGPTSVRFALTF